VKNSRQTCPRIAEIEDQIGKLTKELLQLVEPTDEEMAEARETVYANYVETDDDMISDLEIVGELLDSVEREQEDLGRYTDPADDPMKGGKP
jgi:hypothetical protein